MQKSITHDDLIRFIYNETGLVETETISTALTVNWSLREQYDQLMESVNALSKVKRRNPDPSSIKIILDYSSKTEELQTHC